MIIDENPQKIEKKEKEEKNNQKFNKPTNSENKENPTEKLNEDSDYKELFNSTRGFTKTGKELGSGKLGKVFEIKINQSNYAAIKCTRVEHTNPISKKIIEAYKKERNLYNGLKHPNIIKVVQSIERKCKNSYIYALVMEKAHLGSLKQVYRALVNFENFYNNNNSKIKLIYLNDDPLEYVNIFFINQIIDVVEFIHRSSVVHFDIKPENILVGYNFIIKFADFNLSEYFKKSEFLNHNKDAFTTMKICGGTDQFLAPQYYNRESIYKKDANKVDIFSMSSVIYTILTNTKYFPKDEIEKDIEKKKGIKKFELDKDNVEERKKKLINDYNVIKNDELRLLVANGLSYDTEARPDIYDFLKCSYLQKKRDFISQFYFLHELYKEKYIIEFQKTKMYNKVITKYQEPNYCFPKILENEINVRNKYFLRRSFIYD